MFNHRVVPCNCSCCCFPGNMGGSINTAFPYCVDPQLGYKNDTNYYCDMTKTDVDIFVFLLLFSRTQLNIGC